MVHRFRKQKSWCNVIAILQSGIAAPTLTVMQGFQAKKDFSVHFAFPVLCTASILRILPFHAFAIQALIEPGCDDWKANALTATLRSSQQCNTKMFYLNQMYKKKAIKPNVREKCTRKRLKSGCLRDFCVTSFY